MFIFPPLLLSSLLIRIAIAGCCCCSECVMCLGLQNFTLFPTNWTLPTLLPPITTSKMTTQPESTESSLPPITYPPGEGPDSNQSGEATSQISLSTPDAATITEDTIQTEIPDPLLTTFRTIMPNTFGTTTTSSSTENLQLTMPQNNIQASQFIESRPPLASATLTPRTLTAQPRLRGAAEPGRFGLDPAAPTVITRGTNNSPRLLPGAATTTRSALFGRMQSTSEENLSGGLRIGPMLSTSTQKSGVSPKSNPPSAVSERTILLFSSTSNGQRVGGPFTPNELETMRKTGETTTKTITILGEIPLSSSKNNQGNSRSEANTLPSDKSPNSRNMPDSPGASSHGSSGISLEAAPPTIADHAPDAPTRDRAPSRPAGAPGDTPERAPNDAPPGHAKNASAPGGAPGGSINGHAQSSSPPGDSTNTDNDSHYRFTYGLKGKRRAGIFMDTESIPDDGEKYRLSELDDYPSPASEDRLSAQRWPRQEPLSSENQPEFGSGVASVSSLNAPSTSETSMLDLLEMFGEPTETKQLGSSSQVGSNFPETGPGSNPGLVSSLPNTPSSSYQSSASQSDFPYNQPTGSYNNGYSSNYNSAPAITDAQVNLFLNRRQSGYPSASNYANYPSYSAPDTSISSYASPSSSYGSSQIKAPSYLSISALPAKISTPVRVNFPYYPPAPVHIVHPVAVPPPIHHHTVVYRQPAPLIVNTPIVRYPYPMNPMPMAQYPYQYPMVPSGPPMAMVPQAPPPPPMYPPPNCIIPVPQNLPYRSCDVADVAQGGNMVYKVESPQMGSYAQPSGPYANTNAYSTGNSASLYRLTNVPPLIPADSNSGY